MLSTCNRKHLIAINNMDKTVQFSNIKGNGNFRNAMKFLPLLLLYVLITITASTASFQGDEGRYIMFATNLSNGYYSPQNEVYLWNGPGYPIVLLPFVMLGLPWIAAKLLNCFFLFGAIIYFYHTLRFYFQERTAILFSYMLGMYYPFWRYMHALLTEQLAVFLICGFFYHFCRLCIDKKMKWIHILSASFCLGFLALTKIFFGYVILTGIILSLVLYIVIRNNSLQKTFLVYLFAMILCLPYLFYTYSLTGKTFYWGNSGGLSLYLMSSPVEEEFGDWGARNSEYHQKDYEKLEGLSNIERDSALKRMAIENIKQYPRKYFKNWVANIGRLWFNYPFSYKYQKLSNYFYIVPNMFVLVLLLLCIYPTLRCLKMIPYEVNAMILFTLISFGGMTPLDAESRYLWPLIPLFVFWIAFVLVRILKIEFRNN